MNRNVIKEIKSLNTCMIKKIFSSCRGDNKKTHPRPLQVEIMDYLLENNNHPIYQKDIEEKLKISKAAVSDVLNSMEQRGIIIKESDENDARKKRIIMTDKAQNTHKVMMEKLDELNDSILNGISDEELKTFYKVISKLKENMKKEGV